MNSNYLHSEITGLIIKAFYNVYNSLGFGFLEKVYENAMLIEMGKLGLRCDQQKPIEVFYENKVVGVYYADIIVNDVVIIELKAVETICGAHEAQLVNYLRASKIEVGLLLNFGKNPQHKKRVLTVEYKNRKSDLLKVLGIEEIKH
jgi:GxxExxY protein